jgi:peroxiredoxin 2/4
MINLIGKKFIDFTSPAVLSNGNIVNDYVFSDVIKNKYALIFFYPMDFTFVCPSELISINNRINEFSSRNVEIIGISIDSQFVHNVWRKTDPSLGGIGSINYTLVSDVRKTISNNYGVLDENTGVSYRSSFMIDDNGYVRVQHINDFSIGRNIDEYIRLFDALIFNKNYGQVCQAGWTKGQNGIIPSPDGISDFLKTKSEYL